MTGIAREEVVQYLRWLADQPDGVRHRAWLFHAAHLIMRDATLVFRPLEERHGDQSV